jgi:uridine kinase
MFSITINDQTKTFEKPIRVHDVLEDPNKEFPVVLVNNRLREMSYRFSYNAIIEPLTLNNREAVHVYEASLRYLIAMAFYNIYPDYTIKFKYSVSRSIFCYIMNDDDVVIGEVLNNIQAEMRRLVDLDLPLVRIKTSREHATKFYQEHGYYDRIDILQYRPDKSVHFYECGDYRSYMYSYMVPSTGYLKAFNLFPFDVGFLIQYPRAETDAEIPPYRAAPKYIDTLRKASIWADVVHADNIADLNRHITDNASVVDFIHMCEAKHNAMLTQIGDMISDHRHQIRLIAIAGPSSSGKTTFANRLRIELMTRGMRPIRISLDDYYLDRDSIPKEPDGSVDLEALHALDVDLFNQNMHDLIEGRVVQIPRFDFGTKMRGGYHEIQVTEDNPIIIEGIHALNDELTSKIDPSQTFKVYISPQLQLNLDNHNPISITNLRLLRRIVRDKQFRNASAMRTISMWDSVRKGEFRWIYPNQEHADYVYNSGLQYELNVLKKYALPTLMDIPNESEHYITANRLIKFLKHFVDIEDKHVPNNSLLREFIGGSCFRDE